MCGYPWISEEGVGSPGAGAVGSCEPSCEALWKSRMTVWMRRDSTGSYILIFGFQLVELFGKD